MGTERGRVLVDGLVLGLLGYGAVAGIFCLADLAAGRSAFATPALLGSALTGGDGTVAAAPVLAYNALHLGAFLAAGLGVAWLVHGAARYPAAWLLLFFVAVGGFMFSLLFFLLVAVPMTAVLPWWSVVAANLAAALTMGAYLLLRHGALWRTLSEQPDTTV